MLQSDGHDVDTVRVRPDSQGSEDEKGAVTVIDSALASPVEWAAPSGRFPLVVAGNCSSCLGTLAGLQAADPAPTGVLFFDAHGDLNTPETSPSGIFDGMGFDIALGRSHADMRRRIGLLDPVPERLAVRLGGYS